MNGKTVLITGASSGIGRVSAIELAKMGARILLHARNIDNGERCRDEVSALSGNTDINLFTADFSDLDQVREMAGNIKLRYPQIDVLLNNAGVMAGERKTTAQGYELHFGVNHLSHFLLTQLLIDKLKVCDSARIINVSSTAHNTGRIYFDDINLEKNYRNFKAYAQSKLANILFTNELVFRLENDGITANSLHPGIVGTRIGYSRDPGKKNIFMKMGRPFLTTPEKGARTQIYLASSPEAENFNGQYFSKMKAVSSSKLSYDLNTARRLWEISLEMTGLEKSLI